MFYLLKDNRIIEIDNAEFNECGLLIVYEETGFYTLLKLDGTTVKYSTYFVENQSENVYDLIDWDKDLVGFFDETGEYYVFPTKKMKAEILPYIKDINAIYKPNEKGDYIKVWEKKNG